MASKIKILQFCDIAIPYLKELTVCCSTELSTPPLGKMPFACFMVYIPAPCASMKSHTSKLLLIPSLKFCDLYPHPQPKNLAKNVLCQSTNFADDPLDLHFWLVITKSDTSLFFPLLSPGSQRGGDF